VNPKVTQGVPVAGASGAPWDLWMTRILLAAGLGAVFYVFRLPGWSGWESVGAGLLAGCAVLLGESRLRRMRANQLVGVAVGAVTGLACALLVTLVVSRAAISEIGKPFVEIFSLVAFGYLGTMLGAKCGAEIHRDAENSSDSAEGAIDTTLKLLDTSVLIDGRIADICETHFVDGTLGIPQFVLHELQLVADSADMLKRQRGRRGLEVLQRIQKMPHVQAQILIQEPAHGTDVDHKLVALAQLLNAKIVTNDFNLNKVASVQGIAVLNINQLANALKPAVLPGEPMRVLILREGKEANQGVAYLDDGTMVVVDGARRLINKTVEVVVTSVHQTTAGKMIFGRLDERGAETASSLRASAAAAGSGRAEPAAND